MKFIVIDGIRRDVEGCWDCPMAYLGTDLEWADSHECVCKHPRMGWSREYAGDGYRDDCPLKSDDLLPCPFCGGEAEKFTFTSKGHPEECVRCKECGISTGWFFGTGNDKSLAKVWNRRQA